MKDIIVLTGFHGCGKSYAAKIIQRYLDVVVNINKYDLITRYMLYLCDIQPINTELKLITNDHIDHSIINEPKIHPLLEYCRDTIRINAGMNKNGLKYFLVNILNLTDNINLYSDPKVISLMDSFKLLYDNKKTPDIKLIYEVSKGFYDNVLPHAINTTSDSVMEDYLNKLITPYLNICKEYGQRIIYYAYNLYEVNYFKKQGYPIILLDMEHTIRSNMLAASEDKEKFNLLFDEDYKNEMQQMKRSSTALVKNNFDFDRVIGNKIMYTLQYD